jgi:hypothetical protein
MLESTARVLNLLLVIATAVEAQESQPTFKFANGAWESLQQGSADAAPELRVSSQVRVMLKGDSQSSRITFRFIQRIRARTEHDARLAELGSATITGTPSSTAIWARGAGTFSTLEVYVPPQVKTVNIEVSQSGGIAGGDIEASEFKGSLLARTPAGDIQAYNIGGSLQAYTGGGHIRLGQVEGNVNCSTGGGSITVANARDVTCQTGGGEILVKQARGPVSLSSSGGNIAVQQASQGVEAHTMRGEIVVGQAGGTVTATTGGGAIRIGSAAGVRANSANGPVYLTGVSGALSVSTALGSILAQLMAGARLQNSSLMAASGDITVMIPSSMAISVMATNERGGVPHVDSDFPGFRTPLMNFGRPPLAQGNINGGGPTLMLSGSDMIYLRKSK